MSGLEGLRRVAEAATPGPWEWEPPSKESWPDGDESLVTAYVPAGEQYPSSVLYGWGYDASGINASDEDRSFIATFNPLTVLALLDRLAAAEAAVERCRARMDRLAEDQQAALNVCGRFEEHLVIAVNLYSEACDDLSAALGDDGAGKVAETAVAGSVGDWEAGVTLGDVEDAERLSGPGNEGMA